MEIVIVVWCNTDYKQFENNIPLKFVGQRNEQLGFSNKINVLFLEGYNLIGEDYIRSLEELGYSIHDASVIYKELTYKYNILNKFGDYEQKCFLRWLVIAEYLSGEKIIHFDGDVVFNECPKILSKKFKNKTFVLQGCPAFTVISNTDWYSIYKANLDLFTQDIQKYSELAWLSKPDWEYVESTWTGMRDRKIISSDQDLIRHLLHSKMICQNMPNEISDSVGNYILFENPLYLEAYNSSLTPFNYKRVDGIDYFNDKKVAIWHMQYDFYNYCAKFIFRKNYLPFYPQCKLKYQSNDIEDILRGVVNRYLKIGNLTRFDVYNYFFGENDFKELFSYGVWHRPSVFNNI